MNSIKVLDSLTASQIAAGEVVERPVSVIKELVENSIDAGAKRIKITLQEGGLKRIQVRDDGCGMSPDDLIMAPCRHATSKIEKADDLNSLQTLGFRGEALPSIAAVSRLYISSRQPESTFGYRVAVTGGNAGIPEETGCPPGTVVTVDYLFYNTPARKKFLKSQSTELGHAVEMVGRIAMSRPDVSFELEHDGKNFLKTPGNGNLSQAVYSVYGGEIARKMIKIVAGGKPEIFGLVSRPELTRSTRNYYNFIINGRLVKSSELAAILEEAYYTRIPAKRYPIAVIRFRIPPDSFDVNVHPAKMEVKFRDLTSLRESFSQALQEVLSRPQEVIPKITPKQPPVDYQKEKTVPLNLTSLFEKEPITEFVRQVTADEIPKPKDTSCKPETPSLNSFTSLKTLGQLDGTYIVATGPEGLYIIDQHAAHERIRYEKVRKLYLAEPSASEYLAVPVTVEFTSQQVIWLVDHILKLTELGFVLEHFGENTFLMRGVPKWNKGGNSEELLLAILEKLGSENGTFDLGKLAEEEIFTLACKSAVKANRHLTEADINYLFSQLDRAENPYTCPHGRPVLIKLTREEIKRRFLRT